MVRIKILSSAILLIAAQSLFGQESRLYSEIQQVKKANVNFTNIAFQEVVADTAILKEFHNPNEVLFFEPLSNLQISRGTKAIEMVIPMKTSNITLELVEVPDDYYNYQVVTSSGDTLPANRNIRCFRGAVKGKENSLVAITLYNNEAVGFVIADKNTFELVKDKSSGKHLFYNAKNLRTRALGNFGTMADLFAPYDSSARQSNTNKQGVGGTRGVAPIGKKVYFYVETAYDIYAGKGADTNAVKKYVDDLFFQVNTLFFNEGIETAIKETYIWTSDDPNPPNNYPYYNIWAIQLADFRASRTWNSTGLNGDLGILLSFNRN